MRLLVGLSLFLILSACSLPPGQTRKITAWGIWNVNAYTGILGVGYWHSEAGEGVESEKSASPMKPK